MIEIIHKILYNRNCGHVRIFYVRVYPSDSIGTIANRFGLKSEFGTYFEVSPSVGLKIVTRVLSRDQAYGTALKFDSDSLGALMSGYENAIWYSNTEQTELTALSDSVQSWSWNPATESTFDMGVIVRNGDIALCIWAEDED